MENSDKKGTNIEVNNAGLMLINPYCPMLFHRLGYLAADRRTFKDRDSQVRAIFLLQYLAYGEEREHSETELYLNKLLVGMVDNDQPLSREVKLTQDEIEWVDRVLKGVCQSWDKMRNTSMNAFQRAFLQRKGYITLVEEDRLWNIRVEEKPYDVLLDTVPWSFKVCMFPWLAEQGQVQWR